MEKLHQSNHAMLQGTSISDVLLSMWSAMLCMLMRVCCAGFWIRLINPDASESAPLPAQLQDDPLSKIPGSAAKLSASRADPSGGGGVGHESGKSPSKSAQTRAQSGAELDSEPAPAVSPLKSKASGAASSGKGRRSAASSPANSAVREAADTKATIWKNDNLQLYPSPPPPTPTGRVIKFTQCLHYACRSVWKDGRLRDAVRVVKHTIISPRLLALSDVMMCKAIYH